MKTRDPHALRQHVADMDRALGLEWPPLDLKAHISAYLVPQEDDPQATIDRFLAKATSSAPFVAAADHWRTKTARVYLLEIYDGRHIALLSADDAKLMPAWHAAHEPQPHAVSRFEAGALLPGSTKRAPRRTLTAS